MSLLRDEPGAEQVEGILKDGGQVIVPFIAMMELRYRLVRDEPAERVDLHLETLRASGVEVPESTPEWGRRAAEVKARGGLSLADAWIAALALMRNAELVHKDPEFDRVPGLRAVKLTA
jgi:predicted nucleic acid-binding protein